MGLRRTSCPRPFNVYQPCPETGLSWPFNVSEGLYAEFRTLTLPEGWCMCIERYEYPCGCSGKPEFFPVCCDTGCELNIRCPGSVYLPPGRYHAIVMDENGDIPVLDPDDVFVSVTHYSGDRPLNEC